VPDESNWSRAVIPGDSPNRNFAIDGGISKASGGIFSTINDLAKLGTGVLNSTLLPSNETRKWMKPVSHTADLSFSVGRPWEIYRYTHPNTGAVTDMYTKEGDSGDYTGFIVLLPDYDAGFNILSAATTSKKSILIPTLTDYISNAVLPALEAQAAVEAERNFAGTFASKTLDLNSSLTISFNDSSAFPGLYITSWISNGTDMLPLLPDLLFGAQVRLLPSISGPGQVAFRSSPVNPTKETADIIVGPFSELQRTSNSDWLYVDVLMYGGVGLSLFVFDVGEDGRAGAVEPAAMRVRLERVK
jgi:Beta-lactamase